MILMRQMEAMFSWRFSKGFGEMWATETSSEQFCTISALAFVSLLVQDIFWWQLLGFRPRLEIQVKLEHKQCKMREKETKEKEKYITCFNVFHTSFIFRFDSILEHIKQKYETVFNWTLRLFQYKCWQANASPQCCMMLLRVKTKSDSKVPLACQ